MCTFTLCHLGDIPYVTLSKVNAFESSTGNISTVEGWDKSLLNGLCDARSDIA